MTFQSVSGWKGKVAVVTLEWPDVGVVLHVFLKMEQDFEAASACLTFKGALIRMRRYMACQGYLLKNPTVLFRLIINVLYIVIFNRGLEFYANKSYKITDLAKTLSQIVQKNGFSFKCFLT